MKFNFWMNILGYLVINVDEFKAILEEIEWVTESFVALAFCFLLQFRKPALQVFHLVLKLVAVIDNLCGRESDAIILLELIELKHHTWFPHRSQFMHLHPQFIGYLFQSLKTHVRFVPLYFVVGHERDSEHLRKVFLRKPFSEPDDADFFSDIHFYNSGFVIIKAEMLTMGWEVWLLLLDKVNL